MQIFAVWVLIAQSMGPIRCPELVLISFCRTKRESREIMAFRRHLKTIRTSSAPPPSRCPWMSFKWMHQNERINDHNTSFCLTQIFQKTRKGEIPAGVASAVECTRSTEAVESQVRRLNPVVTVQTLSFCHKCPYRWIWAVCWGKNEKKENLYVACTKCQGCRWSGEPVVEKFSCTFSTGILWATCHTEHSYNTTLKQGGGTCMRYEFFNFVTFPKFWQNVQGAC